MKIIFAQGNLEQKYQNTRHNVGFLMIDLFAASLNVGFVTKARFQADIAEVKMRGQKVLLVKPSTYYNETGQSARQILDFYKADPASDLLVLHDDLALPLGTLRSRLAGSDAGNNGIKSLNAHLDSQYARLRIGIHSPLKARIGDADFVLSKFSTDEADFLQTTVAPKVMELIDSFIDDKFVVTSLSLGPLNAEQQNEITDEHHAD